jgi:hypothetical protein
VANPEKLLEMENVTLVLECEDALLKAQWKTTWKNAKKKGGERKQAWKEHIRKE